MRSRLSLATVLLLLIQTTSYAQGTGCFLGRWGVDAGLYSGVIEFGAGVEPVGPPRSRDWFQGAAGEGTINETNAVALENLLQAPGNPTYEERMKFGLVSIQDGQILIDGLYARDQFGGTGFTDPTSYLTASKNGEDPAIWDPGTANVLGKNDIIDVGGHMYRDGLSLGAPLWFIGLFNMAEPGGVSYMDFEFYVQSVQLVPRIPSGIRFTSGGPQLGHTAYTFDGSGNITKIGDFIFSVSLLSSGPAVETRLWVSRADWLALGGNTMGSTPTFQWAGTFDGAFNGAPFGYAGILPLGPSQFCGYVNQTGQLPLAPPWGTKGTKTNSWGTNYIANSIAEVGINLTAFGMDHASLSGADPCFFPLNTFIVKTRASASFTAQLKDFAGPYAWGVLTADAEADPDPISCDNPFPKVRAFPQREDLVYLWSTLDGNFIDLVQPADPLAKGFVVAPNDPCLADPLNVACIYLGSIAGDPWEATVDKVGTYDVTIVLPTNCPVQTASATVVADPTKPFFDGPPTYSFTVPCNVNDGTITVTASGATQPYTFFLYNSDTDVLITSAVKNIGESTHTFTGLSSGNYRVDVKGVYVCIVTTGPFTIPAKIPVDIDEMIDNLNCFGDSNGSITLGVTGGNPPLSYLWNTGNTTQNLTNRAAGTYTVTVTDSDACTTTAQYTITQPTQIEATIVKVDDPGNAGDGSAEVIPSGGTPDYTYLWSKTGDPGYVFTPSNTAQEVTDLTYGAYTVVVTDDNGCTRSFSTFIFEKEICNDGIDNDGDGLTDCDDPDCTPVEPDPIMASNNAPCVDPDGMAPYAFTYLYEVPENLDYDSYEWTVPVNAVIITGQGMEEIEVAWLTTAGGQICVRGKIFDCLSPPSCINVNVINVPPSVNNIQID